jgi:hypothetical protein
MSDTERAERHYRKNLGTYEDPYIPAAPIAGHYVSADERQARALEYIAYQMFMIRKALESKQ